MLPENPIKVALDVIVLGATATILFLLFLASLA